MVFDRFSDRRALSVAARRHMHGVPWSRLDRPPHRLRFGWSACHEGMVCTELARTQLQACVNDISKMPDSQNARAVEQVLTHVKREHGVRMVLGGRKGEAVGVVAVKY